MTDLEEFFDLHERVALQISGGKDSAACFWMLEPYWHKLTVVWANSGNPYPETVEYMERIKKLVPNFAQVNGNQPLWVSTYGYPVEVVPIGMTTFQQFMGQRRTLLVQPFTNCCSANLWFPMAQWIKDNEITGVIRGVKDCDHLRSGVRHKEWDHTTQYFYPIWDWDDQQVLDYLGDRVPHSYKRGIKTSLDCMNCTAFVKDNKERVAELYKTDPQIAMEIQAVHATVRQELIDHIMLLE